MVRAVINDYSSAVAVAVKPICRESKVLHIAAISNSENITKVNYSPYTFQVVPNTYMQAKGSSILMQLPLRWHRRKDGRNMLPSLLIMSGEECTQEEVVADLKRVAPFLKVKKELWPKNSVRHSLHLLLQV